MEQSEVPKVDSINYQPEKIIDFYDITGILVERSDGKGVIFPAGLYGILAKHLDFSVSQVIHYN